MSKDAGRTSNALNPNPLTVERKRIKAARDRARAANPNNVPDDQPDPPELLNAIGQELSRQSSAPIIDVANNRVVLLNGPTLAMADPRSSALMLVETPDGRPVHLADIPREQQASAAGRATRRQLRNLSLVAVQRLDALLHSPDERVSLMAVKEVLERNFGKVAEGVGLMDDAATETPGLMLSQLSPKEREQLRALIDKAAPPVDAVGSKTRELRPVAVTRWTPPQRKRDAG
jgi:hypothetical protein